MTDQNNLNHIFLNIIGQKKRPKKIFNNVITINIYFMI